MTDRGRGAEGDVVLRDGATAHVRPVRPDDEPSLLAFIQGLSDRSRWLRFFSAGADLERAARESSRVVADRFALVATAGRSGVVIGHGGYVRTQPDRAEVAFAVADDHQARGLATTMLGWLAAAAEDDGIATFTASVLPDNHRRLEVFRDSGFPVQVRSYPGELAIEMPSSLTPQARQRFEQRERLAAAAAVRAVLEPRSVAVIGASDRPGAVGAALWANLRRADFTGALHAVNRRGKTLDGAPVHRSVGDVPGPIDLAVVAVPAAHVAGIAAECAAKGVRALVPPTSCCSTWSRSAIPAVRPHRPASRPSQADPRGPRRADAGGRASRGLPHRRPAGGVRRHRGRSVPAGRRRPRRHAGRAVRRGRAAGQPAPPARARDSDPDQCRGPGDPLCGRLRRPRPRARDPPRDDGQPAGGAPSRGSGPRQPGRHAGHRDPDDYRRALATLARDEQVDAVICLPVPALLASPADVARAISDGAEGLQRDVPVRAVFMTSTEAPRDVPAPTRRVPTFAFPEEAARALGHAARYARWRAAPVGTVPALPDARPHEAAAIIASAPEAGGGWLGQEAVAALCGCYGVALADWRTAADPEAARAARALGGPMALKAVGPTIVHKTEVGGVRVGLRGSATVRRAAEQMHEDVRRAGHELTSFLVHRMVQGGVEMIVGVVHDESFGPVVACGAAGTTAELLRDVTSPITPSRPRRERDGALAEDLPAAHGLSRRSADGRRGARRRAVAGQRAGRGPRGGRRAGPQSADGHSRRRRRDRRPDADAPRHPPRPRRGPSRPRLVSRSAAHGGPRRRGRRGRARAGPPSGMPGYVRSRSRSSFADVMSGRSPSRALARASR